MLNKSTRVLDIAVVACTVISLMFAGTVLAEKLKKAPGQSRRDRYVDAELLRAPGGHLLGSDAAKLVVVEFGDYECPACRQVHATIKAVLKAFGGNVALEYRHWPLAYHPSALPAARAAVCASIEHIFPAYHDLLYSSAEWLPARADAFVRLAQSAGSRDTVAFRRCLDSNSPDVASHVERDVAMAKSIKARGTPTIIVGSTLLGTVPDSAMLTSAIQRELALRDRMARVNRASP